LDKPGREGVAFDVSARSDEAAGFNQADRLEATLVDRSFPDGRASEPDPDGMGSRYPMQELREHWATRRTNDQVPVIVHHAIRHEWHRVALEAAFQNLEKLAVFSRTREHGSAGRSPIDDVVIVVAG
jgi:hypothetical protein